MKKSVLAVLLTMMFLMSALCAGGEPAQPGDDAFKSAKEAVSLISYGEYDMAVKRLKMESLFDAKALKKFIDDNCREIYRGSVQTEVSVAWPEGALWKLAVPFEAPDDEAVGELVFTWENGAFTSVAFARWGSVCASCESAPTAIWNVAYSPDYVIVEDW